MIITILGGGSWGTALAIHLAKVGHTVQVWEFFEEAARAMQETRECRLLPGVRLPDEITFSNNMEHALQGSELVLVAVPSDKVEVTLRSAQEFFGNQDVVICSKGFAADERLLHEVAESLVSGRVFCLYGPTHAEEVSRGVFSGIVLAGGEGKADIRHHIESEDFHVDLCDDIVGVQVAASLKNCLAIFLGILDGAGYGDNTKAYVLTKGLREIAQLGQAWGGKMETFYGLAGMGDMIVTCTSQHSRNRHVGEQIGKGRKLQEVLDEMNMIAEGVTTVRAVPVVSARLGVRLPLLSGLYEILEGEKTVKDVLSSLLEQR